MSCLCFRMLTNLSLMITDASLFFFFSVESTSLNSMKIISSPIVSIRDLALIFKVMVTSRGVGQSIERIATGWTVWGSNS
jgi:hypothetical protein